MLGSCLGSEMERYSPTVHQFRLGVLALGQPPQREAFAEVKCSSASGAACFIDFATKREKMGAPWVWRNSKPVDLVMPNGSIARLEARAEIQILPDHDGRLGVEIVGDWGKPPKAGPPMQGISV